MWLILLLERCFEVFADNFLKGCCYVAAVGYLEVVSRVVKVNMIVFTIYLDLSPRSRRSRRSMCDYLPALRQQRL